LFGDAGAEGQGADSLGVVVGGAGRSVLSLVVNLDRQVQVAAFPHDGHLELSDVLHDGVVRGVEHDPHDAVGLLLLFDLLALVLGGLVGLGLLCQLVFELLVHVLLAGQLPGGLHAVVGAGLGALLHDLFAGPHLQLGGGDVGVLQTDPLHRVDVLAAGTLELGQSGVHVVLVKVLELLGGA